MIMRNNFKERLLQNSPLYICHEGINWAQRQKRSSVPGCKHAYFCSKVRYLTWTLTGIDSLLEPHVATRANCSFWLHFGGCCLAENHRQGTEVGKYKETDKDVVGFGLNLIY